MSALLSRRAFTASSIATCLAGAAVVPVPGGRRTVAQEASGLASLGLPELDVIVTADGFLGVPRGLEAGRYLLNVTLADTIESGGAAFISPPEGLSADQLLLEIETSTVFPDDESGVEGATGVQVQPAGVPLVAYAATFAGGVIVVPDMIIPAQVVIDLTPGEWILWGGNSNAPQVPLIFTVVGAMPRDLPEPEADALVVLTDFDITIDGELTPGDNLLRIEHEGEEPHHVHIRKGPDSMTEEQVEQVLRAEVGDEEEIGTLPFDPLADLQTVFVTADQSEGTEMWAQMTLEAGSYVAVCYFPLKEDATPHVLLGQYTVFRVE